TRVTAAIDGHLHVETTLLIRHDQRLLRVLLQRWPRQIFGQRTTVDLPAPRPGTQIHPRDARLATARALVLLHLRRHFRSPEASAADPRADASARRTPAASSSSADPGWSSAAYP